MDRVKKRVVEARSPQFKPIAEDLLQTLFESFPVLAPMFLHHGEDDCILQMRSCGCFVITHKGFEVQHGLIDGIGATLQRLTHSRQQFLDGFPVGFL